MSERRDRPSRLVPGILVLGVALLALLGAGMLALGWWLDRWDAGLAGMAALLMALALPAIYSLFEDDRVLPYDPLRGRHAVAIEDLAPRGRVHLGDEIWSARLPRGGRAPRGTRLLVRSRRGLLLLVERERPPAPEEDHQHPRWPLAAALVGDLAGIALAVGGLLRWDVAGLVMIVTGLMLLAAGDFILWFTTADVDLRPVGGPEGKTAVVVRDLDPVGQVRLDADYWTARTLDDAPVPAGAPVRVIDRQGLVLVVEAASE